MAFYNDEKLFYDGNRTFGEMQFIGYEGERKEADPSGNEERLKTRYYSIYSARQGAVVRIHVPASVPKLEFERKALVRVEGDMKRIHIPAQTFDRDVDPTEYILVDNIVRAEGRPQGQPAQQNKQKRE